MKTALRALLLALALYTAVGLAASPRIDENALAEMRKGQTTFDEIVRRFGRPNFTTTNWDGGRTAAYAYGEGRSTAALTLPALGAVIGGAGDDTVVLQFDGKGLLTDYKVNQAAVRPADRPATPTVRYVEPSAAGPTSVPTARPAAASATRPDQATSAAPVPAGKPEKRSDGLPSWLPSSSTREDRY